MQYFFVKKTEQNVSYYRFESSSPILNDHARRSAELLIAKEKASEKKRSQNHHREKKRHTHTHTQRMVSREQKRAALHEKLQLLRSITNSRAVMIPL